MKKLTLMLCACEMALAMVLVSCKNEPEEYVDVTSHSYDYIYSVTGTIKEVCETGPKDSTTKKISEWTFTKAKGNATWSTSTLSKSDQLTYNISANGQADRSVKDGDADAVKTYRVNKDIKYVFQTMYKIGDKFYIYFDNEYIEVTVSEPKKDGFTYSGSYTWDHSPDEDNINKTTYSIDLTFAKPIK